MRGPGAPEGASEGRLTAGAFDASKRKIPGWACKYLNKINEYNTIQYSLDTLRRKGIFSEDQHREIGLPRLPDQNIFNYVTTETVLLCKNLYFLLSGF